MSVSAKALDCTGRWQVPIRICFRGESESDAGEEWSPGLWLLHPAAEWRAERAASRQPPAGQPPIARAASGQGHSPAARGALPALGPPPRPRHAHGPALHSAAYGHLQLQSLQARLSDQPLQPHRQSKHRVCFRFPPGIVRIEMKAINVSVRHSTMEWQRYRPATMMQLSYVTCAAAKCHSPP